MLKIFIIICSSCVLAFEFPKLNPKTKFFEVILDRVEVLYEDPKFFETHLRVKKVNKTRTLVGYADIRQAIGNDCDAELKTLKKQGGEYRYLPYIVRPSPLCNFIRKDKYFYKDFARSSDFPEEIDNNCSLFGNYSINGYTVNSDNIVQVAAESGEYAAELCVQRDSQNILSLRVFFYINKV